MLWKTEAVASFWQTEVWYTVDTMFLARVGVTHDDDDDDENTQGAFQDLVDHLPLDTWVIFRDYEAGVPRFHILENRSWALKPCEIGPSTKHEVASCAVYSVYSQDCRVKPSEQHSRTKGSIWMYLDFVNSPDGVLQSFGYSSLVYGESPIAPNKTESGSKVKRKRRPLDEKRTWPKLRFTFWTFSEKEIRKFQSYPPRMFL